MENLFIVQTNVGEMLKIEPNLNGYGGNFKAS
jgi:hypothetical protein